MYQDDLTYRRGLRLRTRVEQAQKEIIKQFSNPLHPLRVEIRALKRRVNDTPLLELDVQKVIDELTLILTKIHDGENINRQVRGVDYSLRPAVG